MPEPGVEEEVAAAEAEGGGGCVVSPGEIVGDFEDLFDEFRGWALVGVEDQGPGVSKGKHKPEVALGGVVVKAAGVNVGTGGLSDGCG